MMIDERKKLIENFDEVTAYFFIDTIGAFTWRMNHDASHGRIEMTPELKNEILQMYEEQAYAVNQLTKFGVDPETAKNRPDGDYWKWYEHWHSWHHGMSEELWRELDNKMNKGEDITDMLPKHKWNENYEKN